MRYAARGMHPLLFLSRSDSVSRLQFSKPNGRYETPTHTDVFVDWESVCDLVNPFRAFFRLGLV